MKKYLSKKRVILLIIFIYIFFLGFKFLKGKSLFDTIVEYSNNIYSVNADINNATRDDYSLMNSVYIPIKYIDYRKTGFGRYIVRKEDDDNLYLYNPVDEEESLFIKIEPNFKLYELAVSDVWVVWLEISETNKDSENISWRICAKMINSDNRFLLDEGIVNSKDKKEYIKFLPREFKIEEDIFVYTKYSENIIDKSNIVTTSITTSIIEYNLKDKKNKVINSSYDNYKEELSNIRIDGNNIIWKKKYKDYKKDETTKAEVYKYCISTSLVEKIFETSDVYTLDIKGDNIAIVVKNPEDNIMIYNIKDKSFTNIFYKGSRIEKFIREDSDNPTIVEVKFITPQKLFIAVSSEKDNISAIVYDLEQKEFLNFDKEVYGKDDTSLIQYSVNKNKLLAYVGIRIKNNTDEDISIKNKKLRKIENLYYKYFEYLIR